MLRKLLLLLSLRKLLRGLLRWVKYLAHMKSYLMDPDNPAASRVEGCLKHGGCTSNQFGGETFRDIIIVLPVPY